MLFTMALSGRTRDFEVKMSGIKTSECYWVVDLALELGRTIGFLES